MREIKSEIKYKITLDEDQKAVKESIYNSEMVVITGRAGSGKSLVVAQTILDLIDGKIKESDLERFHCVYFSDETVSDLSTVEISYLMSGFIEDDKCLLFEEVDD